MATTGPMVIHFFGKLGDLIGRTVEVAVPGRVATAGELRAFLAERFGAAGDALRGGGVRACIGDTIVDDGFGLAGAHAVEFFPPLSGG